MGNVHAQQALGVSRGPGAIFNTCPGEMSFGEQTCSKLPQPGALSTAHDIPRSELQDYLCLGRLPVSLDDGKLFPLDWSCQG